VSFFHKVLDFYRDPEYFSEVRRIAVPIVIQQLMFSGLNLLGVSPYAFKMVVGVIIRGHRAG